MRLGRYCVELFFVWDCIGNAASLIECSEVAQETAGSKFVPQNSSMMQFDTTSIQIEVSLYGITVDQISAKQVSGIVPDDFERPNDIITNLPNERKPGLEVGRIYFAIFDDTISFLIRDCGNAFKVLGRNRSPVFTTYSKMLANLAISCPLDNWPSMPCFKIFLILQMQLRQRGLINLNIYKKSYSYHVFEPRKV